MGCYGGGAIAMALFVLPKLRVRFSFDVVLASASMVSATCTSLLNFMPGKVSMGLVLAVAGAGWMSGQNTFSVASQSAFPNWVRARSSAIYLVVMQGGFSLGALTWGQLSAHFGATQALLAAAAVLVFSALLSKLLPISRVEKLNLQPSKHWPEHPEAEFPAPADGPVLITIEYMIDPARVDQFRAAMVLLREVRLRDGAFRCSVFQDIDEPRLFRETFLVGSWAEHLRQHERVTMDDKIIEHNVQALHEGSEPPRVRHLLMMNLRDQKQN